MLILALMLCVFPLLAGCSKSADQTDQESPCNGLQDEGRTGRGLCGQERSPEVKRGVASAIVPMVGRRS